MPISGKITDVEESWIRINKIPHEARVINTKIKL